MSRTSPVILLTMMIRVTNIFLGPQNEIAMNYRMFFTFKLYQYFIANLFEASFKVRYSNWSSLILLGKKRDICQHPTHFLSRLRAVTWTTKLKNTRYACKHRGVNHEEIAECFTRLSSEKTMFLNCKLNHETISFTAQEVLVNTLYRNCKKLVNYCIGQPQ